MTTIALSLPSDTLNPDGRRPVRRGKAASQAEQDFLDRHGGRGARALYRVVSIIA